MKLISWNVNGIRACVQKGFLEFFREADADIFCLQETKLQAGQIELDLEGYEQYWNYAVKKGYSGTAVFTKKKPLNVTYGIGIEEHDQEGRVITLEFEEFYFVTVYTPNSQNELARLDYRMKWESDFLAYLKKLEEEKPVIFCGDLNVAHKEIDLKNPKTNRKNAGFTDEERGKFTEMLNAGFIDTFRYFYPDQDLFLVVLPVQCQSKECRVEDRLFLRFRMFEGPACGCEDPDRGYGIRPLSDRAGFKIKRRE